MTRCDGIADVRRAIFPLGVAAAAVAAVALAGSLGVAPALAATEWPIDGDCTTCHVKEAFDTASDPAAAAPAEGAPTKTASAEVALAEGDGADAAGAEAAGAEEAAVDAEKDADAPTAKEAAATEEADGTAPCTNYIAIHSAFGCATCHADQKLGDLHDGATPDARMPKKLKKTEVDDEVCLNCHESYEALAEKSTGSQALVDDNGTVVNPHALPDVADHEPIGCVDCHTVHKDADKPVTEKAKDKCLSCHHENVFECGTCHEG